jgi:RecA/RadA recombinase
VVRGEKLLPDFPRIPTSIFTLDYAIGGGFPISVASCLYGPPGGGKSLVLQKTIASAQKLCWKCFEYEWDCQCSSPTKRQAALVAPEGFDPEWAKCLGVNVEELIVVQPEYGEQAADIISEAIVAEDCGLIGLDSIAMLSPIAEVEGSFDDGMVAAQARLVARMMRVVQQRLVRERKKNHPVAFIATNHIRSKIGQLFGNPEDVPGGWAAKHSWHLTVRMSQVKSDDVDSSTDMPINAKFRASTVALTNKRKLFTLQGLADFYISMVDSGEFKTGTVPDFKSVEKYADEIEFIERNPWRIMGREYEKKSDLINDWQDEKWYLSVKKKLVQEYKNIAKIERDM